jgi:co-chaperonin GroES (HSP10)
MMKAIGKNIVIRQVDEEVKTASGLVLSGEDTNQLRYKRGKVVTPGTDVKGIAEGDEIYYDKAQSYTMIIHDEQFTIIQERDVVLVL